MTETEGSSPQHIVTSPDGRLSGRLLCSGHAHAPLALYIHGGGCSGRYFQIPGFSAADRAMARGFDVLLVDRPGHGLSPPARTASPLTEAADLLPALLAPVLEARSSPRMVVIGHSIGGAVALMLAARGWPSIGAVAVSGIGRTPSIAALSWFERFKAAGTEPPPELFFGARSSYDWRAPIALRKAVEPWRIDDVRQTLVKWPHHFDSIASSIRVPILLDLAEHEGIWQTDELVSGAIAANFRNAARVETSILPDGGHLYELHARGGEMMDRQLTFLASPGSQV